MTAISSTSNASEKLKQVADKVASCMYEVADTFNRLMVPGYAAYADGGSVEEVVTSAGSDLVLTYFGAKVLKLGYQGAKYVGGKVISALQPKKVTWGLWSDLPKTTYKGKEYAKIGKYYYTHHAIDHMSFGALNSKIPSSQVGQKGLDMRRISSMVVEEVIKYGKKYKFYENGEWRLNHTLGDVQIITTADTKIVITARRGTK